MPWFDLGSPQDPSWRGTPYHMLKTEVPTWYKYLSKNEKRYEKLYYNVCLTIQEIPTGMPPKVVEGWLKSSSKRVDAVGLRVDGTIDLIEVAESANLRSIGQSITYRELWKVLKPLPGRYRSIIVCEYANPDVAYVCGLYDIAIIETRNM